jgi:acyl-CoA synthetase (NDP forming)
MTPNSNGIIATALKNGRTVLSEVEAKDVLAAAGIPVVEAKLAASADEAVAIADDAGYPVALKIVSDQITHKSDVGGVILNIADANGVRQAFDQIMQAGKKADSSATIDGVSVQRMADPGVEVITGMTMDPQFGPVLMFGLGGVLVEVLKDVAFRIVPITDRDAGQMIRDIKGFPVLEGIRGQEPADVEALESLLVQLSKFIEANPQVAELDLNPVFAYPKGAVAVDARIVLAEPS